MKYLGLENLKADLWVFDNDGTLYPNSKDLEHAVGDLMDEYIAGFYSIKKLEASKKRKDILQKYNTKYTLIALRQDGISEDDFIQKTYLSINPVDFGVTSNIELTKLIGSLAGEKIILTNNPSEFAGLILKSLGIKHFFSRIIGMRERNYVQKPSIGAFEFLMYWLENDKTVVLVDDCLDNITIAKSLGCVTIFVEGGLL